MQKDTEKNTVSILDTALICTDVILPLENEANNAERELKVDTRVA